jgi:1-aminocyclopropane-1-carboxylate deaminase
LAAKINKFAARFIMEFLSAPVIRVQSLKNLYQPQGVEVAVLRLDEVHPLVSGNKWFKLQGYIKQAREEHKTALLTFGGAFSNHILATAAAAKELGLQAIGVIRGERSQQLSTTLTDAESLGMQLHFITREAYKHKEIPGSILLQYGEHNLQIVNEGGYGLLGRMGIETIAANRSFQDYTHIITAVGTGTTLAGLVCIKTQQQEVIGLSALKNAWSLTAEINSLLPAALHDQYTLLHDHHFGGYAKSTPALFQFMNNWYSKTAIPLDFVYTGKAFFAVDHLIRSSYFAKGSRILIVHTGGLQGNRSLPKDTLIF